jgi:hypothetical protein
MTRHAEIIRLLTAVMIGLMACLFVMRYDDLSHVRFRFDHPEEDMTPTHLSEFVKAHSRHAFAVPVVGLLLGSLVLWRWPNSHALVELILSLLWILAFLWVGLVLILWQVQNIPLFSGMRFHY